MTGTISRWCVRLLLMSVVLGIGCQRTRDPSELVARVGKRELRRSDLQALAGVPLDSLSVAERWQLVQRWIERALLEQEGERRRLAEDPVVREKLAALRAELFRSHLLAELPASAPSDSLLQAYYERHRAEFQRTRDAYLIELFWAEKQDVAARLRSDLLRGDTTLLARGEAAPEGRWLAETGELDPEIEREIATLNAGEVTFPRPYEDGYRVVRLIEVYPAGTPLDFDAVRSEIASRVLLEQSRARQDSLLAALKRRYPVQVFVTDSL